VGTKTPILVKTKIEIKRLKLKNHMFKMGLKINFITNFGAKKEFHGLFFIGCLSYSTLHLQ